MRGQGRATLSQSSDDPVQVPDDYPAHRHGFPPCSQARHGRLFEVNGVTKIGPGTTPAGCGLTEGRINIAMRVTGLE
jgi:hypothetical protein